MDTQVLVTINTPVVNMFQVDLTPILNRLGSLESIILANQATNQENTMAVLDDLEAKVAAVKGVEDSAAVLLKALHDELVAAMGDPARVQAVIDHLAASSDALAAAVAANPDPAPPVVGP